MLLPQIYIYTQHLTILPTRQQIKNITISAATIVEPTGVEKKIDSMIPASAQTTEITPAQITTPLKFCITRIADSAGKITSAEISREPTRFIASTMITAVMTAIRLLYTPARSPVALAKFSSNVTAKMRLYRKINTAATITDMTTHSHTSALVSVRIEVEPKSVLHTSPEIFADVENRFITRYPTASEPTESKAIAASPWILGFCPVLSISIAAMTVTGITTTDVLPRSKSVATASAPNATCESPSPM